MLRCEAVETVARLRNAGLACSICGCTDDNACEGGCYWVKLDPPICSACREIAADIFEVGAIEPMPDVRDGSSGFFGNQDCAGSNVPAAHALVWVTENTGYCARCREGFVA